MRKNESALDLSRKRKNRAYRPVFSILLCAVHFAGTQATRTNSHRRGCAVNNRSYFADVGLPGTVGLTVGVRNVLTEHHTFSANAALCHF